MIEYFKKQGYVFINYSKSNYNYSPYAKYEEDFDTHHVSGVFPPDCHQNLP